MKLKILENEFQSISAEFNRVETQLSEHRTLCLEQYVNDLHKSDWTVREGAPRIPGPNDGALLLDDLKRVIEDDKSCLEKVESVASNFVLKSGAPFVARTIESMIKRLRSMMTSIRSEINEIESDTFFSKGKGLKSELK